MRVVRGRDRTPAADRERTQALLEWVSTGREPAVRVWRAHKQVAFGRRDAAEPGYDAAREAARIRGFTPVERDVGGRAVAYTGSTIAFARIEPIEDLRRGLAERYGRTTDRVQNALAAVGIDARAGEPPESFCPGNHSLQAHGKLVGIAQRVTGDAAVVSGILVVDGHEVITSVLEPVYNALEVPFDPDSVGSVVRAGGDPDRIRPELESALVGSARVEVESIRGT